MDKLNSIVDQIKEVNEWNATYVNRHNNLGERYADHIQRVIDDVLTAGEAYHELTRLFEELAEINKLVGNCMFKYGDLMGKFVKQSIKEIEEFERENR